MLAAPHRLLFGLLVAALLVVACQPIQPPTPVPSEQVVAPAPPPEETPTPTLAPTPTTLPTTSPAPAASSLLQEGIRAHEAGDYEQAIATFTEALEVDPTLASAYVYRAAAYLRLGELKAAVADCDAALLLDSELADAYFYRGAAYAYLDEFELAVRDLTEAIRLNPSSVDAHVYRGASHYFLGHYAASVQDCTNALHLSGGYFLPVQTCLNVMGEIIAPDFEHADAALRDFDLAIREHPDFAGTYLFRGLMLRARGEIEAAVRDLEEALRLDPSLADPLLMYWSFAYMEPADPDAAIQELETALALVDPDSLLASIIALPLKQLRGE